MSNTSMSLWMGMCLLLGTFCPNLNASTDTPAFSNPESEMCNEKPLIYCPAFVWLKPSESSHPNRTGYALADPGGPNCGTPIVTFRDEIYIINACHKVYTRIWTATDPNNSALADTCHQTIKQVDEIAPVISNMPADVMIYTDNMDPNTINCSTKVSWIAPTGYDDHLLSSLNYVATRNGVVVNIGNGDFFLDGVTTITYTALDFCGNFSTASFDITVRCADCHLDCPDDVCLPLNSDISPQEVGSASSYSGNTNCGTVSTYYLDELIETGCNGKSKTLRTWYGVFTNMPQNTSTCVQTIELKDQSALVLHNCPSDVNVIDNFTKAHWESPVAVASDNQNVITLTSNYTPGNLFPIGITTVIYKATDACGNEASCSFKVSVLNDATYKNCPDDIDVSCGPGGTTMVTWEAPIYDGNCSTCKRGAPIYGFMYMGSLNGSNYYCSKRNYEYAEAKVLADKHGGHIACINSAEENSYLSQNIISSTAMIGYTDLLNEGTFVWDDGSNDGYSKWFQMQPNNQDNQDVVELMKSTGLWNDVENDKKLEFILEIPCQNVRQIDGPLPGQHLSTGTYTVEYLISDGCGLNQFCKFDINVNAGISLLCKDDIYVEVPTSSDEVSVTWDAPSGFSCCTECTGMNCLTIEQTEGPVSGSTFYRQSKTQITYVATDLCGNSLSCSFFILVDIDEGSGRIVKQTEVILPTASLDLTSDDGDSTTDTSITNGAKDIEQKPAQNETDIAAKSLPKTVLQDKFYPNPMTDLLNLDFRDHRSVSAVMIFNQTGHVIVNNTGAIKAKNKIDVSGLSKGVYIVRVHYSDSRISTQKLIKI